MKKVLITGGAGYLGSVLTEFLLLEGYEVTVIDNLFYKQISLIALSHYKKFNFVKGDVNDVKTLKKLVADHDIIIPLAAIVGMAACQSNPDLAIKVNYEQVKNICNWTSTNQKILIPNTNSQYGSSTSIITEESEFKPLSLYAITKCDAEKCVLDSGNGIALRLATVFGSSYRMRIDLLVNDFVHKSLNYGYIVLFESHFIRNYIHVRDIARTFLFMIKNYDECNNNAFNVGLSSANLTKFELANKIKEFIPDLVIIKNEFGKDKDQRNYMVSNSKIESKGWSAKYTLEDGIAELIKAYSSLYTYERKDFTNSQ